MQLLDHIREQRHFRIIDASSNKTYTLDELLVEIPDDSGLIFLYMDNSLLSLASYFSCIGKGNTIALLSISLSDELKTSLEAAYVPNVIIDPTRKGISDFRKHLSPTSFQSEVIWYENPIVGSKIHADCQVLLSTSGTTGSPKFVKLSWHNLYENAKSIHAYLPIEESDITPLNLPLHYSYGLSVLHSNAIAGAKVVCGLPDILRPQFWDAMQSFGFTSIAGVPFVYEMLERIGFRKKEYDSLKYISQAGGNLNEKIKRLFLNYCNSKGISFFVMYGQTEASARISYVPANMLGEKITSIGKPIKNGTISLDPESSEIIYNGPNVYGGYAECREDLATYDNSTVLRTGDIGKMDPDGFYYVVGRLKRFVKLFGNRINLDEVENTLKLASIAPQIACKGLKDTYLLVVHTGEEPLEPEIKKILFSNFKINASAIKTKQIPELPLTSNGKIDYKNISI